MRKSRRKRRRRRRTRRGRGKKGKKGKHSAKKADRAPPDGWRYDRDWVIATGLDGRKRGPLAWKYLPENNNSDNISHKSVESEGNFPDTTNGELSMEKTIEGQQPRDDGGGGPTVGKTARARNDAPKNWNPNLSNYYFPSAAHAVAGRPKAAAAAADDLPPLEELSKSEKLRRELASSSYSDVEGNAVVKRRLKGRWRNAARGAAAAAISAGVDPTKEFKPLFPSHLLTPEILADPGTRTSLEIMKRDTSPLHGLADGLGASREAVTPPPDGTDRFAAMLRREREEEGKFKLSRRKQKQWETAQEYDKEDLAREAAHAAAAAVRDKKVVDAANDAANAAAAETMFELEMGGGRRKRRRKRRRTRKKRAGYGPITTGGWIHHNLLLPSQHLGSLGMWWT